MTQNLSSYYIFYIVAKSGNISTAAKELFISQPAVSKSIQKLEENLETKLLVRNSRGVSLTHEGEILYHRLDDAFHSIKLGEEQIKFENSSNIHHLTIGVSTTLCKYLLLPHLKDFVAENPNIRITITCQPTYQTLEALKDGSIDIGLVGEPDSSYPYNFKKVQSIHDTFVTTQSYLDHLTIQTGIEYQNLIDTKSIFENATLMLIDSNNLSRKYADYYINTNNIKAENIIEVSTMDLLIEFASVGLGIACVIKNFVQKELKEGTLIEISVPSMVPKRNIGFVYQDKEYSNPAINTFLEYYANAIQL